MRVSSGTRAANVGYDSVVGERCRLQTGCLPTSNLTVEEDVFFGPQVASGDDNYMGRPGCRRRGRHVKKGTTGGMNASMLFVITIGEKAVVGGGAVVNSDLPDGETHVGVHASSVTRNHAFGPG